MIYNKFMEDKWDKKWHKHIYNWGGHLYGLGFLGAAFYFLQHVSTIEGVIIGLAKAVVWPALVVYRVLGLLHL